MKVAITGHAFVIPENRVCWQVFAQRYPNTRVTLIVPDRWSTDRYGDKVQYKVKPERYDNFEIIPLPFLQIRRREFYRSFDLALRRVRPDILQIDQEHMDWRCTQALVYSRFWSPGTVTIGGSTANINYTLTRPYHIWKEKFTFSQLDAMTAMNEEVRHNLRAHGFNKPILIQHGIGADEHVWQPGDGSALRSQLELKDFVIGFVGALHPEKGVLDLVRAVTQLSGEWSLLVIGGGPMRDIMVSELSGYAPERARFLGFLPRQEIPPYMRCMDVLVLPSRTTPAWKEQFGLVLAEAMLCHVPVVGSDSGAIPEVIGDAGLIFPEGDVSALAAVLRRLKSDPVFRQALAACGRQRALERFSTSAISGESYQFFRGLLESRRGRRN